MVSQEDCERICADYFGRRHCLLVGRGSAALYIALRTIAAQRGTGEVILPSMGCWSLAQTVVLAGFEPVFCDVTLDSFCMAPSTVAQCATTRTRAIVPVHLFGYPADMPGLSSVARKYNAFLLEDVCHAPGGSLNGRRLGGFGDFAFLSFGGTKVINAGGGGALLTDDDALLSEARDLELTLKPRLPRGQYLSLSQSHRNFYHAAIDLLRSTPDYPVGPSLDNVTPAFRDWLVYRWATEHVNLDKLRASLLQLDSTNARRTKRAEEYQAILQGVPCLRLPRHDLAAVRSVWRYSFLAETPDQADSLSHYLRTMGLHASNHYWSLAHLLQGDSSHSNTVSAQKRIVNLWVDETVDDAYIARTRSAVHAWRDAILSN